MTQTEQNGAVRTREEQVKALVRGDWPEPFIYGLLTNEARAEIDEKALSHILEAEVRGAAEQRQKAKEGRKWSCNVAGETFVTVDLAVAEEWERGGFIITEHNPANVAAMEEQIEGLRMTLAHSDGVRAERQKKIAALEARIAALEEYYEAHEDRHETGILNMTREKYDRIDRARAALIRESEKSGPIDYLSEPGPGEGAGFSREGGV